MASPYWKYPGSLQGRIEPAFTVAEDGSYVFCLGEDAEHLADHMLQLEDSISVEQDIDLTGVDLIRFRWKLRTGDMPLPRVLVAAGAAAFKDDSLMASGDALQGVDITVAGFLPQDRDRWLRVSGSSSNDGDFRVSAVPATQTNYTVTPAVTHTVSPAGRMAVLEGTITDETAAGATITMLGLRWNYILEVGGTQIFSHYDQPNTEGIWRQTLAANVSKLTGTQTVKFALSLEAYE